jgi:hypothetical protein
MLASRPESHGTTTRPTSRGLVFLHAVLKAPQQDRATQGPSWQFAARETVSISYVNLGRSEHVWMKVENTES